MSGWRKITGFVSRPIDVHIIKEVMETHEICDIYPDSIHVINEALIFLARGKQKKVLVVIGEDESTQKFSGKQEASSGISIKVCPLTHQNCAVLRELFPFTAPLAVLKNKATIGLGDRLGIATPGHIRAIKGCNVKPVLAQQSIRELNLTGRTYEDVLDDVSWAVFQEGYTRGFGADGDHLKKPEEVKMALDCGFTMITLDCSEHIDNSITFLNNEQISEKYNSICGLKRNMYEEIYKNKLFKLKNGQKISFDFDELKKIVLIYHEAISFAVGIYNKFIKDYPKALDLEISIDETLTPTSPQAHYFFSSELFRSGVKVASLAPKFCGEFQKGIDYIGNTGCFEKEFREHVKIAEEFGYKISIHSGSDKFRIFPIAGKHTEGRYHLKTAGTSWLEAVRVVALKDPGLYRQIHKYALSVLDEAKKYYYINADTTKVPDVDLLKDNDLPSLMDNTDVRQVIHITYGHILKARDSNGEYMFRNRINNLLYDYEEDYCKGLEKHIGKHLTALGCFTAE